MFCYREIDLSMGKHSKNIYPNSHLNASPKSLLNDNWIQPKQTVEAKNYSQHWLYQVLLLGLGRGGYICVLCMYYLLSCRKRN